VLCEFGGRGCARAQSKREPLGAKLADDLVAAGYPIGTAMNRRLLAFLLSPAGDASRFAALTTNWRPVEDGVALWHSYHQLNRNVNCSTRAGLSEFRFKMTPSAPGNGVPGMLKTLSRKSTLNRAKICSLIRTVLKAEALMFHRIGPKMYWFCKGWTPGFCVVRCTVPFFKGTHIVLVS
jgi:hypothetical protein